VSTFGHILYLPASLTVTHSAVPLRRILDTGATLGFGWEKRFCMEKHTPARYVRYISSASYCNSSDDHPADVPFSVIHPKRVRRVYM